MHCQDLKINTASLLRNQRANKTPLSKQSPVSVIFDSPPLHNMSHERTKPWAEDLLEHKNGQVLKY